MSFVRSLYRRELSGGSTELPPLLHQYSHDDEEMVNTLAKAKAKAKCANYLAIENMEIASQTDIRYNAIYQYLIHSPIFDYNIFIRYNYPPSSWSTSG